MPDKKPVNTSPGFSPEEKALMKERARELKAEAARANGETAVLEKFSEMPPDDRAIAERLHQLIKDTVPALSPRTWYGMPAYAKDGKVLCFFQSGGKFGSRYCTFGFQDIATLDEGAMWPTSFALKALDSAAEGAIVALLKKAVGSDGG